MKLSFLDRPGFSKIPADTDLIEIEGVYEDAGFTITVRYYDVDGEQISRPGDTPKNPPTDIIK